MSTHESEFLRRCRTAEAGVAAAQPRGGEQREFVPTGAQGAGRWPACMRVTGFGDDYGENTTFMARFLDGGGQSSGPELVVRARTSPPHSSLMLCSPNYGVGDVISVVRRRWDMGAGFGGWEDGLFCEDAFQLCEECEEK